MIFQGEQAVSPPGRCLGFAVPISYCLRVSRAIISKGRVDHVWLGAMCKTLTPQLAGILGLGVDEGVLVMDVEKGSPAWKAGLKAGSHVLHLGNQRLKAGGDVIVAVNGQPVRDLATLVDALEEIGPGNRAVLSVIRKGKIRKIAIKLGKKRYRK